MLYWSLQTGGLWATCSLKVCFVWFTQCWPMDGWVSLFLNVSKLSVPKTLKYFTFLTVFFSCSWERTEESSITKSGYIWGAAAPLDRLQLLSWPPPPPHFVISNLASSPFHVTALVSGDTWVWAPCFIKLVFSLFSVSWQRQDGVYGPHLTDVTTAVQRA